MAVPQRDTEKAFDASLGAKGHRVDRPTQLITFVYTKDPDYPVEATVKHTYTNVISRYRCKYLIGGDGAGSVTRHVLGITSDSNDPEDFWAVADMELETSFPDQRRRSHIRTPAGALMMIPCAFGINRIYIQLTPSDLASLGGAGSSKSDSILMETDAKLREIMLSRVREILQPFTADIKRLQWISQYRIKQRIISKFYDGSRVFVVGDACHTHSPKAAQGLNVSMMDAYNLTWKLALVLQGKANSSILDTYNSERLETAKELIGFDRKVANLYVKKEFMDKNADLTKAYHEAHGFTAGVGIQYNESSIVTHKVNARINLEAIEPLTPGKRLLPSTLIRHVDGTVVNLLDDMPSNGRFHLFVFAGKNAFDKSHLASLAAYLSSPSSILTRYSSNTSKPWVYENVLRSHPDNAGRTVDLFLIHAANYYEHFATDLPSPLPDWKHRVYADEDGKEHQNVGVDVSAGALALVRPDGYIAFVTDLQGGPKITEFMDRFMVVSTKLTNGNRFVNGDGIANGCGKVGQWKWTLDQDDVANKPSLLNGSGAPVLAS